MKRILLLPLLFLAFFARMNAQSWLGFTNSNYGGTNSVYFNPSAAADNRYSVYLNVGSLNLNFANNYVELKTPYPFNKLIQGAINGEKMDSTFPQKFSGAKPWDNGYVLENLNGKSKFINLSSEVRGPALMFSWNNRNTIGFGIRERFALQVNDLAEPLARLALNGGMYGLKDSVHSVPLLNKVKQDNAFGIQMGAYMEYSATYAREILRTGKHYLKGGITVKRLEGQGAIFVQNKGTQFNLVNKDSLWAVQTDLTYGGVREQYWGIQDTTSQRAPGTFLSNYFPQSKMGSGYGFDIGFTYEYRPDHKKYESRLDGKPWIDNKKNKYEYKIGVSLTDLGNIKYSDPKYAYYHTMKGRNIGLTDTAFWGQISSYNLTSTQNVDTAMNKVFGFTKSESTFTWVLPSALNINADFKLKKNIYVGAVWIQSIRKINAPGFRTNSLLSIIPRFEGKWIECSFPMTLAQNYTKFTMGAFLRMGPLFIGSDNLGGFFGLTTITGFDVYAGATIPLYRKAPKDRDKDGVSDRLDRCVRVPGPWELRGCPDQDSDGVEDTKDRCPLVKGDPKLMGCPDKDKDGLPDDKDLCPDFAGPIEKKGCPDRDGDGIYDQNDKCPDNYGVAEMEGCPDRDGDGVTDLEDRCPDLKGEKSNGGCPDRDGDGVNDNDDACPDKAGPAINKGCPDSDGDGLYDAIDDCPDEAGLRKFKGCPDRDLDNVPDKNDKCPDTYGDPINEGCPLVLPEKIDTTKKAPVLTVEEQDILQEAFDNLEFQTGKSAVTDSSKLTLNKLADLLKKKAKYKLVISGHTDNVGAQAINLKLSLSRAEEVKRYLVSKGVNANRIKAEGFGDTRPVADNATDEGRQKNRRVELRITQ